MVLWHALHSKILNYSDFSGDGAIDEDEFTSVCVNYGIPEDECRTAFRKFSSVSKFFKNFVLLLM